MYYDVSNVILKRKIFFVPIINRISIISVFINTPEYFFALVKTFKLVGEIIFQLFEQELQD